jgi:hypothetical protein
MTTSQILDFTDTETTTKCTTGTQCPSGTCTAGFCAQGTIQQLWGNISCLDETIEAHDGRIRPVFE